MKKLFIILAAVAAVSCNQVEIPEFAGNFTYNEDEFAAQYALNKAEWDAAFAFLQDSSLYTRPVGVCDTLTTVTRGRTQKLLTAETRGYEVHRRTIDVFYVIEGVDKVGISEIKDLGEPKREYNEKSDAATFKSSANPGYVVLEKGQGVILFPCDAHSPNLCVTAPDSLKLAVVKIPYIEK